MTPLCDARVGQDVLRQNCHAAALKTRATGEVVTAWRGRRGHGGFLAGRGRDKRGLADTLPPAGSITLTAQVISGHA